MSNLLTESHHEELVAPRPTRYLAESLGSRLLQLCPPEITLTGIIDGEIAIYEDSVIFDPHGLRVDTLALLAQVEAQ